MHDVLRCLANVKNGKFIDILKCILWDLIRKVDTVYFCEVYICVRLNIFIAFFIHVCTGMGSGHKFSQHSRHYLDFCPDPKHFDVNCEQNGVIYAEKMV